MVEQSDLPPVIYQMTYLPLLFIINFTSKIHDKLGSFIGSSAVLAFIGAFLAITLVGI